MVVAAGDFQLGMVLVALAAQLFRRGKIEGGSCHRLITKEQWQEMQFRQGMVDTAPDAGPVPDELAFEGDAIPQSREMPPFDM